MKTNIRLITSACFVGVCYLFSTCMLGVYTYKTYRKVVGRAFFKHAFMPAQSSKIRLFFKQFYGKTAGQNKNIGFSISDHIKSGTYTIVFHQYIVCFFNGDEAIMSNIYCDLRMFAYDVFIDIIYI